jgi:hypothetical protein
MTPPDDATLRRYVLGQLPPDEGEALEAAYFADGDLVAALDDAADALAREYLDGTLDAATRSAFTATLERPAVAARLAVVQGLRRRAAAAPAGTAAVVLARRRPIWQTGLAAAAGIVLAVGVWRLVTLDRPTTDRREAQPQPGAETTVTPPPAARTFVALTLSATATRSAGAMPAVEVPPGIDDVVLSVTAPVAPGDLAAEVRAVDTDRTWRGAVTAAGPNMAAGPTAVVVPAGELPTGDYILSLRRGDRTLFRAAFRVIHRQARHPAPAPSWRHAMSADTALRLEALTRPDEQTTSVRVSQ